MTRRVAITGMGALSCIGLSCDAMWRVARSGTSGIAVSQELSKLGFRKPVGVVEDFEIGRFTDLEGAASLDPFVQYAVAASIQATTQAALGGGDFDPYRMACFIGSGAGAQTTIERSAKRLYGDGATRLHPMSIPRGMFSGAASYVAMVHGVKGVVLAMSSACASASHAIGHGFQHVRSGAADLALVGGSEACLAEGCLKSWEALRVLTADQCRPFCASRSGLALAEGSAVFLLEEWSHAEARGARILAEVQGFGASSDAGAITAPDADGMARSMRSAISDAGLQAADIDHVNAHGTGTILNDKTECAAIANVFGDRDLPVTANKSIIGHTLGASGALELVLSVLSLQEQYILPTIGFAEPDPACAIDCVPNTGRDARLKTLISNSFAFGGLNASIVVGNV